MLNEQEKKEQIAKEQEEVLKLMTSNREQVQYKKALATTISQIRAGGSIVRKEKDNARN